MTRTHRAWHWRLWLFITPLVIAGLAMALLFRPADPLVRDPSVGPIDNASASRGGAP